MILSLPQKEMDISEILEENIERELKKYDEYLEKYYGENKKLYKYIEKIRNLLLDKILY